MNGSNGIIVGSNSIPSIHNKINLHQIDFTCPKCYSFISINIINNEENQEKFVELICENNHIEKILLKTFLKNYQNYLIKECQICHFKIYINQLLYCFSCDVIFCKTCKEKHLITNNIVHLIELFILKDKKCKSHKFKSNEYYCYSCKKYICNECLQNLHDGHNIIKYISNNDLNKKLKIIIEKEEHYKKMEIHQLNKLILKINQKFQEINDFNQAIEIIKKNILKTYETNKLNYNICQSLNIINSELYNKKKLKYNINKLNQKFGNNVHDIDRDSNINNKTYENKNIKIFNSQKVEKNNKNKFSISHNHSIKSKFKILNNTLNNGNTSSNLEKYFKKNNINNKEEHFIDINIILDNISEVNNNKENLEEKNEINSMNSNPSIIENNFNFNLINNKFNSNLINNNSNIINNNNINNNSINNNSINNNGINNIKDNKNTKNFNKFCDKKNIYKVIQTNNNIKDFFCLPHNIIIISFDNIYDNISSLNKLIYDAGKYIQIKHLKYINIFKDSINDVNSYQDGSLLICTNNGIAKIKINDYNNGDYSIVFRYNLNNYKDLENKPLLSNSNLKICLPLSNKNFITCNEMKSITYWKKEKSDNLEEDHYNLQTINVKNFSLNSMKEIADDLIVINMQGQINNKNSYNLLYLKIDKDNIIKIIDNKIMMIKLNTSKNTIQKINDNYFLALLYNGFIIIDILKREICRTFINKDSLILFLETKLYGEYLYNFILERKNINNKLIFKSYKNKISDIHNNKMEMESGKDLFLNSKNELNRIYLINEPIINNDEKNNNGFEIILVGNNTIIIFNYFS